jgi:hypothetical protein
MWHAWERNVYRVLMGKPEERDHLEGQGVDVIKMVLRDIGWRSVDWIQLTQDKDRWRAVVNTVMNLRVLATRS